MSADVLNSPAVSIIIPCYNCQQYIEETLECLARQTYQGFEVICVNDGSKDETLMKLQQWVERGNLTMRVISQENGGVSRARNRGMQEAKGRYILFLDADDLYHSTFVERMYKAIEEADADTVYCKLSRDMQAVMTHEPETAARVQTQTDAMRNLLHRMGDYGFYCYMYRKDILEKHSIYFREGQKYFEDREFNWKYMCHCSKVLWLDEALYGYRIAAGSAMRKKVTWDRIVSVECVLQELEEYMSKVGCSFYAEFKGTLYSRVAWGWAKNVAVSRDKAMYDKLIKTYDIKACMQRTTKDGNWLVALFSRLYLINPWLMYYGISWGARIKPM